MLKFYEKYKRPWTPSTSGCQSNDPSVNFTSGENNGGGENNGDELSNKKVRVEGIELKDDDIVVDLALRKPIEEYDP